MGLKTMGDGMGLPNRGLPVPNMRGTIFKGRGVNKVGMEGEILYPQVEVELMEVWWVLGERGLCPSLSMMRDPQSWSYCIQGMNPPSWQTHLLPCYSSIIVVIIWASTYSPSSPFIFKICYGI